MAGCWIREEAAAGGALCAHTSQLGGGLGGRRPSTRRTCDSSRQSESVRRMEALS